MPGDGQADPIGVTNLLAKAARKEGVKIFEKSPVEKIIKKKGQIAGVIVNGQAIECEYVVLATGMWSRQIGEDSGFSIPLYPAEHFYVITEGIKELPKNIPVLRDFDDSLYLKARKNFHTICYCYNYTQEFLLFALLLQSNLNYNKSLLVYVKPPL